MNKPIMMAKEYWMNSQFSVARFFGGCKAFGYKYFITDAGDLVRSDYLPYYEKLKRDRFMEILKENQTTDDKELRKIFKEASKRIRNEQRQLKLF